MASGCHTGQSKAKSEKNLDFFFNTQFKITGAAYCILEIEAALRGGR